MSRPKTTIAPDPGGTTTPLDLPKRGRPGALANDPELLALFQRIANRMAATDATITAQVGALGGDISDLSNEASNLDGRLDTLEGQNLHSRITTLENNNSLAARAAIFGTGLDGSVSLNGSVAAPSWATKSGSKYILNRDVFLQNLTLTGTAQVITRGYKLYIAGTLDLQNAAAGAISYDGADWADLSAIDRTAGNGGQGGVGGSGSTAGAPAEGANGYHNGGAGGRGGGGSGQIGASVTRSITINTPTHPLNVFRPNAGVGVVLIGGGGGGGGGQANASAGAGGNGAGVVAVFAYTIARGASTPAAAIAARGQAGVNSSTYGGGGGGGGWVFLVYGILSGTAATNGISVAGGNGGTGTTANGNAGTAGRITLINVVTGAMSETSGTATANL